MAQSLQDILNKANKKAQSGIKRTAKPKPGRTVWRILPGWDAKEPFVFYHSYGQHFIKDLTGKLKVVVGCSDKIFDEPCDVCEAISDAMRAAPSDKIREQIKESQSGQRFLCNAIEVSADPKKVVVMEVGIGLFRDIIANIGEDESLIDADKGRDFVINREGTGLNTKYSLAVRGKDKSISVPKSALMELNDLTAYVTEDFDTSRNKALLALGAATGKVLGSSSAAGALTGPDDALDDEIPEYSDDEIKKTAEAEIEDADVDYDTSEEESVSDDKEEKSFGEDISDEDIDSMLAGLD